MRLKSNLAAPAMVRSLLVISAFGSTTAPSAPTEAQAVPGTQQFVP